MIGALGGVRPKVPPHRQADRAGGAPEDGLSALTTDETAIEATYRKGILEITVPLTAPQPAGRQIAVTAE